MGAHLGFLPLTVIHQYDGTVNDRRAAFGVFGPARGSRGRWVTVKVDNDLQSRHHECFTMVCWSGDYIVREVRFGGGRKAQHVVEHSESEVRKPGGNLFASRVQGGASNLVGQLDHHLHSIQSTAE